MYVCDLIFRINSLEEIQVAKTEAQKLQASRTIAQTRVVVVRLQMLACSQAENFLFTRIWLLQWIHVHCTVNSIFFWACGVMSQHYVCEDSELNWIGIVHTPWLDSDCAGSFRCTKSRATTGGERSKRNQPVPEFVHHIPAFLVVQDVWMLKA